MTDTQGAPQQVLIVEDDPVTADVMTELLESNGFRVAHASTAGEARRMVQEISPDLVVLDLILPDVDGLTFCSELRLTRDVPIIICSATNRNRDAVLGLRLGADDFVSKPFDITEFEARVAAVLRRAQQRAA